MDLPPLNPVFLEVSVSGEWRWLKLWWFLSIRLVISCVLPLVLINAGFNAQTTKTKSAHKHENITQ